MLLFWMALAGAATTPEVALNWKGEAASLSVRPPEGHDIAEDSPADVVVRWAERSVSYQIEAQQLAEGVALWAVRGQRLDGDLGVTFCSKADGLCRTHQFSVGGTVPASRKGTLNLDVSPVGHAAPVGPQFQTDAQALADQAFQVVRGTERRVLLDFSAVWCPPCNQLAAEVLHASDPPEILEKFEVVVLDVDDARSWGLKDRYHVGGYPTVVIADAEGRELGREVGFPGRDSFVEWLEEMAEREAPAPDPSDLQPSDVTPPAAGAIAWTLVENRGEGVAAWIARAESGALTLELVLARVSTRPNLRDARWLLSQAPDRALDWVPRALSSLREEPEGPEVLRAALSAALSTAGGVQAADLLYWGAQLADEGEAPLLYAAAAAVLRESFSGEPFEDRAHYTFLAGLMAKSGDVDGALQVLQEATKTWPREPTFHLKQARVLLDEGSADRALPVAEACVDAAWGDNRLRCGALVCEALTALDRSKEARERARELLTEQAAPAEALDVRTPRYRQALQAFADAP
jgi:thioredoxin-like negative regulator of GroEL